MANSTNGVSSAITSIPIGELVRSMAMAIADAQFELDKSSLMVAEFMSGRRPLRNPDTGEIIEDKETGRPIIDDTRVQFGYTIDEEGQRVFNWLSMMELGFVPNFYQFVDTVIEVKLALRVNQVAASINPVTGVAAATAARGWGAGSSGGNGVVVSSTPIDAGYSSAYNFNLELASVFKTKLVPVPPPAVLEERLRELVRQEAPKTTAQEPKT